MLRRKKAIVEDDLVAEEVVEDVKPAKRITPKGNGVISVKVDLPDGTHHEWSHQIKNVHDNIPPSKLNILFMQRTILKGLQKEYGMGVSVKI